MHYILELFNQPLSWSIHHHQFSSGVRTSHQSLVWLQISDIDDIDVVINTWQAIDLEGWN